MIKVTFLTEVPYSDYKSQKSTNSATHGVTPSKDNKYVVLYTFRIKDEARKMTIADFLRMASEKTGIMLDSSDFKKSIMHFTDDHWEEADLDESMSDLHDFGLVMTRKRVINKFLKNIEDD